MYVVIINSLPCHSRTSAEHVASIEIRDLFMTEKYIESIS